MNFASFFSSSFLSVLFVCGGLVVQSSFHYRAVNICCFAGGWIHSTQRKKGVVGDEQEQERQGG